MILGAPRRHCPGIVVIIIRPITFEIIPHSRIVCPLFRGHSLVLSSIHSAGCHTCHVTHVTEQSWVVKLRVTIGPVSILSFTIVSIILFVVLWRRLVNRFTSVVMVTG